MGRKLVGQALSPAQDLLDQQPGQAKTPAPPTCRLPQISNSDN